MGEESGQGAVLEKLSQVWLTGTAGGEITGGFFTFVSGTWAELGLPIRCPCGAPHLTEASHSVLAGIQEGCPYGSIQRLNVPREPGRSCVPSCDLVSEASEDLSLCIQWAQAVTTPHRFKGRGQRHHRWKVQRFPIYTLPLTCVVSPLKTSPTRMAHP